jgi:hypothetical protein
MSAGSDRCLARRIVRNGRRYGRLTIGVLGCVVLPIIAAAIADGRRNT